MQLRDWVQEKFGGTGQTLLDESVYANRELRKDLIKLEHSLKKLENEMDKHRQRYEELLRDGADGSELERKKFAQKAKFEKKKYAIKKKKYRASSVKYGTLLSIQGMREIAEIEDRDDIRIDELMQDTDAQEIQNRVIERMATFGVEMEDLSEIQDALDIPIMETELDMDVSEEEQIMDQLAASEISTNQVDIDAEIEFESTDIDIDDEEDFDLNSDVM